MAKYVNATDIIEAEYAKFGCDPAYFNDADSKKSSYLIEALENAPSVCLPCDDVKMGGMYHKKSGDIFYCTYIHPITQRVELTSKSGWRFTPVGLRVSGDLIDWDYEKDSLYLYREW